MTKAEIDAAFKRSERMIDRAMAIADVPAVSREDLVVAVNLLVESFRLESLASKAVLDGIRQRNRRRRR